jgi:hypothetical protein
MQSKIMLRFALLAQAGHTIFYDGSQLLYDVIFK